MTTCRDSAELSTAGGLRWHVATLADEVVVSLAGELDLASAPVLVAGLAGLVKKKPARLIVDFAKLSFMDSSGIKCLVAAARSADAVGCRLIVRNPTHNVARVLESCGVDKLLLDPRSEGHAATRR